MANVGEIIKTASDIVSKLPQTAKGKPIATTSIITLFAAVVGLVFMIEDRYALAKDLTTQQHKVEELSQSQSNMVEYLKINARMKKTILEMKGAQQGLTPAERVELQGIDEQLKVLDKK